MSFTKDFEAQVELIDKIGIRKAYLTWVMGLYIDETDLLELASEALTDSGGDRKIDFIKLDLEAERIVLAQAYYSQKDKAHAPPGKSTELNTALAWLLSGELSQVPDRLRAIISDCRSAIASGEVAQIHGLFVHNLPESSVVEEELETTRAHIATFLEASSSTTLTAVVRELGTKTTAALHAAASSPIQVVDEVDCSTSLKIREVGNRWTAYVCSISGTWLHAQFAKYGDDALFSANYRGFLGISRRGKINTGIRTTAETSPGDFWVYNNGITVLTRKVEKLGDGNVRLHGMSIINGAQTTGSIGQVDPKKHSLADVSVLCRFIECDDAETISRIVRYNNTQNEITTWDQYSNDPMQVALREEFHGIGYDYRIKRTAQRKGATILVVSDFAQPSLAFHGRWRDANRGKNTIFDRRPLYQLAFEGRRARHLLFAYTLKLAVDNYRLDLKQKDDQDLTEQELRHLAMLRHLKFKNFLMAVIAGCLEGVLNKRVDDQGVAFQKSECEASNRNLKDLALLWQPVVTTILGLVAASIDDNLPAELARDNALRTVSDKVNGMLMGILSINPDSFSDFREAVEPR